MRSYTVKVSKDRIIENQNKIKKDILSNYVKNKLAVKHY